MRRSEYQPHGSQGSAMCGEAGQRASLWSVPQEKKIVEWPPPDENDDAF
jgi:hypothetical protein